jgi:hypothetical protein
MKVQLLKGSFNPKELEKILAELINVKIKYHESKINSSDEEETMKMRENRIIKLQNELSEIRKYIQHSDKDIMVESEIKLN